MFFEPERSSLHSHLIVVPFFVARAVCICTYVCVCVCIGADLASQVYNSIRVFITAYVWMTGFGNFSFFYLKVSQDSPPSVP